MKKKKKKKITGGNYQTFNNMNLQNIEKKKISLNTNNKNK